MANRFFIACYNRETGAYQGVVKPASLVFDHVGEAVMIARRYAKAYPNSRWTVLELDPHGRRIRDHELTPQAAIERDNEAAISGLKPAYGAGVGWLPGREPR
jgi:hypothetical protein